MDVPAIETQLNKIEAMLKARELAEQRMQDAIASLATREEVAALQRQLTAVEKIAVSRDEVHHIVEDALDGHPSKEEMLRADQELKQALTLQLQEMRGVQEKVNLVFNEAMASFNRLAGLVEGFLELIKGRNEEINNLAANQRKLDEELKHQIEDVTDVRNRSEHIYLNTKRDLDNLVDIIKNTLVPGLNKLVTDRDQRKQIERRRQARIRAITKVIDRFSASPLGVKLLLTGVGLAAAGLLGNEALTALFNALFGGS